jgi:hypothetical protein
MATFQYGTATIVDVTLYTPDEARAHNASGSYVLAIRPEWSFPSTTGHPFSVSARGQAVLRCTELWKGAMDCWRGRGEKRTDEQKVWGAGHRSGIFHLPIGV